MQIRETSKQPSHADAVTSSCRVLTRLGRMLVSEPQRLYVTLAFLRSSSGQDMVEYALILAFVALAGAAAMVGMSDSINTLWSVANSRLAAASN